MSSSQDGHHHKKIQWLRKSFVFIGVIFIGIGIAFFGLIFQEIFKAEVKYTIHQAIQNKSQPVPEVTPVNTDFGIVVPKIAANAPIIVNVDPYNEEVYQEALTRGIAHARGSSLPDIYGTMFLFAHSAENFYQANRYNAIFYLLNKLEKNDDISIFYKGQKYSYKVTSKQIVNEMEVNYLSRSSEKHELILMTCWPPGTSFKRLLIFAEGN